MSTKAEKRLNEIKSLENIKVDFPNLKEVIEELMNRPVLNAIEKSCIDDALKYLNLYPKHGKHDLIKAKQNIDYLLKLLEK